FEMGTGLQRTDRHGRSSARKRRVFCPESTTPESGRLSGSSGRSPSSRGNARIPRSQEIPMPTEPRKLLVCVKRVADYDAPVRVRADGSAVVTEGVRTSLNPFDEIALEEALRIRERGDADEVVVCSVGPLDWQHQLRTALAMGADRAVLVAAKDEALEPLAVARVLRAVVAREAPRLVLLGKQAVDRDDNQVWQMLAALWDRPQATFASALRIDGSRAIVDREVDTGIETIEVDLPAVVSADLRLNQPRYVKLPEMLKAK